MLKKLLLVLMCFAICLGNVIVVFAYTDEELEEQIDTKTITSSDGYTNATITQKNKVIVDNYDIRSAEQLTSDSITEKESFKIDYITNDKYVMESYYDSKGLKHELGKYVTTLRATGGIWKEGYDPTGHCKFRIEGTYKESNFPNGKVAMRPLTVNATYVLNNDPVHYLCTKIEYEMNIGSKRYDINQNELNAFYDYNKNHYTNNPILGYEYSLSFPYNNVWIQPGTFNSTMSFKLTATVKSLYNMNNYELILMKVIGTPNL